MNMSKKLEIATNTCEGITVSDLIEATDNYTDILKIAINGKEQNQNFDESTLDHIKELLSQLAFCQNTINEMCEKIHKCLNEQFTEADE